MGNYNAPKGITSHPGVESCEYGPSSGITDYRHEVLLRNGWTFKRGRMAGGRCGNFNSVADFKHAEPFRKIIHSGA